MTFKSAERIFDEIVVAMSRARQEAQPPPLSFPLFH